MKIAVSWDNGSINGVFAETKYFALYEYEPDDLDSATKKLIDVSALEGEEALCKRLRAESVDAVLVGEMSAESHAALLGTGIVPVIGYSGPSDAAADLLAAGMLPLDANGSFGGCGGGCAGCGGGCSSEGCSSGCCGC